MCSKLDNNLIAGHVDCEGAFVIFIALAYSDILSKHGLILFPNSV